MLLENHLIKDSPCKAPLLAIVSPDKKLSIKWLDSSLIIGDVAVANDDDDEKDLKKVVDYQWW